jgi:hypothetical protein
MGCNCGGGRGREVTVSSAGASYATRESNVKWRHYSEDKPLEAYRPGDGRSDYNSPAEAQASVEAALAQGRGAGRVVKVDQDTGRPLD